MNILLIDDEQLILQSIQFMLGKLMIDNLNVYCVSSMIEALKIAAFTHIDLAIVDIQMGADNGLDVICELQKLGHDCDYYLLSGYSEFEFAKRAIELQVKEYLLKPVTSQKLESITKLRLKRQKAIHLDARFKISEMLSKGLSGKKMVAPCNYYYQTLIFPSLKNPILKCPNEHLLQKAIEQYPQVSYVCKQVDMSLIVMLFSQDIVGFSQVCQTLESLKKGYITILSPSLMTLDELQVQLANSKNHIIQKLFDNEPHYYKLYDCLYKLLVSYHLIDTYQFHSEYVKADDLLLENDQKIKCFIEKYSEFKFGETDSISDIINIMQAQLPQINEIQIDKVIKYIEDNYHLNIGLEHMSFKFDFNANYFSDWFKKQTGLKFIDYVTKLRIEKAKVLLLNTDLTIAEITEKVGYLSSSYFLKVFTKYENQTPNNFRRKR